MKSCSRKQLSRRRMTVQSSRVNCVSRIPTSARHITEPTKQKLTLTTGDQERSSGVHLQSWLHWTNASFLKWAFDGGWRESHRESADLAHVGRPVARAPAASLKKLCWQLARLALQTKWPQRVAAGARMHDVCTLNPRGVREPGSRHYQRLSSLFWHALDLLAHR
jgi:hypothetical protein